MKKQISFPSIEQFRNVVSNINRSYAFTGLDENGNAIYDNSLPKPALTFKGTVKLHGTNAGISYNEIDGMWAQSRENIITPQKDNAGFAFFVESHKDLFLKFFKANAMFSPTVDLSKNTMTIYGEWAGKGIQKGVGISEIEKSFFIFAAKVTPFPVEGEEKPQAAYWIDSSILHSSKDRIYNIENFKTYSIDIDFNMPQLIQNKLSELTIEVENECPVSKELGFEGIGEGIVWSCELNGIVHRFKVKGEKHSVTKVKTLAAVDVEKLNSIKDFVEYAVTENRLEQAVSTVCGGIESADMKNIGDILRWMINDIIKEEMDVMSENNLEPKEVNKYVSQKTKEMFIAKLNSTL